MSNLATNTSAEKANLKPLGSGLWWLCFAVATVVLSFCFGASRTFFEDPSFTSVLPLLAWLAVLGIPMVALMFDSYVNERLKGKVTRPIALFEWAYVKYFSGNGEATS